MKLPELLTLFSKGGAMKKISALFETIHPLRDWILIMSIACVLFLTSLVYNIQFFLRSTESVSYAVASSTIERSDAVIQDALEYFESQAQYRAHLLETATFTDPSL